ncbi:hypothetical protein KAR91_36905 [Candidatus Pacearchaeota archaeon]|nr:hypothetical protein [Candidatus Pacearchaeota archaeon]
MSFTQKILIPLSDQVDTSAIEHKNVFESEGDRIALASFGDDFDDNSIDLEKWNVIDTGSGSVVEQNQRIEITGSGTWDETGLISDNSFALVAGQELRAQIYNGDRKTLIGLLSGTSLTITPANGCYLSITGSNNFNATINGSSTDTGYNATDGKTYNTRIVYLNPGWSVYIQSPDDATYATEVLVHTTATDSTGPLYVHRNTGGSGTSYLDDVSVLKGYPTSSPSPAAVWTGIPAGAVIDMSTAKCWMFKDDVIQPATNTDIKFKYAINNGTLSTSLTLAALRAEDLSGTPITDSVNSFKPVGVYASDGTYESKSTAWLEVDVLYPEGGGGDSKLDNFGLYGHRRIAA